MCLLFFSINLYLDFRILWLGHVQPVVTSGLSEKTTQPAPQPLKWEIPELKDLECKRTKCVILMPCYMLKVLTFLTIRIK